VRSVSDWVASNQLGGKPETAARVLTNEAEKIDSETGY
jgi:hypothetical protein